MAPTEKICRVQEAAPEGVPHVAPLQAAPSAPEDWSRLAVQALWHPYTVPPEQGAVRSEAAWPGLGILLLRLTSTRKNTL